MERLGFTPELKSVDDETGTAQFYASIFGNVDLGNDVVLPGAFAKTLADTPASRIGFLVDHEWDAQHRLGFVNSISEDTHGLLVDVRFNLEKQLSREIYSDFKMSPESIEFSFGYEPIDYEYDAKGIRLLKEVRLFEVSHVVKGMNPATELVGVKEAPEAPDYSATESAIRIADARLKLLQARQG